MRTFALPLLGLLLTACDETRHATPTDATFPDVPVVDARRDFGTAPPGDAAAPDDAAPDDAASAADAAPADAAPGSCGDSTAMDC